MIANTVPIVIAAGSAGCTVTVIKSKLLSTITSASSPWSIKLEIQKENPITEIKKRTKIYLSPSS